MAELKKANAPEGVFSTSVMPQLCPRSMQIAAHRNMSEYRSRGGGVKVLRQRKMLVAARTKKVAERRE